MPESQARTKNIFRSQTLRVWIMLSLALLGIFAFALVAREIMQAAQGEVAGALQFDGEILKFFSEHRTPLLNRIATDITSLGSVSVVVVLSILVITLLLSVKDFLGVGHLVIVLIGSGVIPTLLKMMFDRPRPSVVEQLVHVSDSSFPSGHSFGSACFYLTLAFFAARHRRGTGFEHFFLFLFSVVIAGVGVSRMYLGVHYPTDVFAGLCAGNAWALLVACAFYPAYKKAAGTSEAPAGAQKA
ncbi:MAG: phosphatase PAP2 family protein [Proteobacteria bacterium]|nr:MAG: phosphatase PAP2 family protein [Pseudomonadota bacterium]